MCIRSAPVCIDSFLYFSSFSLIVSESAKVGLIAFLHFFNVIVNNFQRYC